MKQLLRKFFPVKDPVRKKTGARRSGSPPMVLSFDGRVVRLRLPQ